MYYVFFVAGKRRKSENLSERCSSKSWVHINAVISIEIEKRCSLKLICEVLVLWQLINEKKKIIVYTITVIGEIQWISFVIMSNITSVQCSPSKSSLSCCQGEDGSHENVQVRHPGNNNYLIQEKHAFLKRPEIDLAFKNVSYKVRQWNLRKVIPGKILNNHLLEFTFYILRAY